MALGLGYWTPLPGDLEGLTILGSGAVAGAELGLLDIGVKLRENAVLVSLVILGLGSDSRLGCGSLGEEPCVTVTWSLQKLAGAICEERNSNGDF